MTLKRVHHLVTLVVCALALFGLVAAWRMSVGTPGDPGPGFWPMVLSLAILLFTVCAWAGGRAADDYEDWRGTAASLLPALATMVAFVVLFPLVGFLLPGILFLVVWLRFLSGESWRMTATVALAAPTCVYLLFVEALGVRFPGGFVPSLIGS